MIETKISAGLVLRLFGPPEGFVNGEPLPRLRSRKVLWALSLIVLRGGRPVSREWLARSLWPDVDREASLANLRPVVSDLRRALGEEERRLRSPDRGTLQFDIEGADIDLVSFDRLVKSGKREDLERAVARYRGPLLEGCSEEWIDQERETRTQDCLQAMLRLGDFALSGGDPINAASHYVRAIALDPWRDASRRSLIGALVHSGDTNGALHAYREFADFLRRESNSYPDEETTAIYDRLRKGQRPAKPSPQIEKEREVIEGYLPSPLTEIVGREDETAEVAALLRRARLVTLTGMGGIGKTRLATAIAAEMAIDFPDGAWFVGLESLPRDGAIESKIASVLGQRENAGRTALEETLDFLRKKRLFLVLDNCEHVLSSCAGVVGRLIKECRELRVLATSREALGIVGETVWAVPPLATPIPAHLPPGRATMRRVMMGYEGVQLFVERARAVDRTFELTRENALIVAQICARLEGIPLAIELAAARTKSQSVERIQERLDDRLGPSKENNPPAKSRQETLRSTLDWSYNLLDESARLLLTRLSVFVGGWTLDAAERVANGGAIRMKSTPDLMGALVDKSLVLFESDSAVGGERYRMLDTVRQYAGEKLDGDGAREAIEAAHRVWALEVAEGAEPELRGGDQKRWLQKLERERENLHAALRSYESLPNGALDGLRMAGALWRFWYVRGDYAEGRERLRKALERDGVGLESARAKALNGAGALAYDQGDLSAARPLFEACLSLCRDIGDERLAAHALNNLANVENDEGDYEAARIGFESSLNIARNISDSHATALALGNLGNVQRLVGDINQALASFRESLQFYRGLADQRCIALTISRVAMIEGMMGDYEAGRRHHEEAIAIWGELGNTHGLAWTLYGLAEIARIEGDWELAEEQFREWERRIRGFNDHRGVAYCCSGLGEILFEQGELVAAAAQFEEATRLFRTLGDRRGLAFGLGGLGNVRCSEGDLIGAAPLLEESLSIFKSLKEPGAIATCLTWLASLRFEAGDLPSSLLLWTVAEADRDRIGFPLSASEKLRFTRHLSEANERLGQESVAEIQREGLTMNLEGVISKVC